MSEQLRDANYPCFFGSLLILLCILLFPTKSLGCSCREFKWIIEDNLNTSYVFEGTIQCRISEQDLLSKLTGDIYYVMKVERYWGMEPENYVIIRNERGGSCNGRLEVNKKFIVVAQPDSYNIFEVGLCSAKNSEKVNLEILSNLRSKEIVVNHDSASYHPLSCRSLLYNQNQFIKQQSQLKNLALQRIIMQGLLFCIILFAIIRFTNLKNITLKIVFKSIIIGGTLGLCTTVIVLLYNFKYFEDADGYENLIRTITSNKFNINWLIIQNLFFMAAMAIICIPTILISFTNWHKVTILRFLSFFLLPGILLTFASSIFVNEKYDSLSSLLLNTHLISFQIWHFILLSFLFVKHFGVVKKA